MAHSQEYGAVKKRQEGRNEHFKEVTEGRNTKKDEIETYGMSGHKAFHSQRKNLSKRSTSDGYMPSRARITRETDKKFQSPTTGKMVGRMEHTYDKDSMKGHKVVKKFGGAGIPGERAESKNKLDLKVKQRTAQ